MNSGQKLLLCYLDGELSPDETERFRARLVASPSLRRELLEMQRVGTLVRDWASVAEARGGELVETTLSRIHGGRRKQSRRALQGYAVLAVLLSTLPWSRGLPEHSASSGLPQPSTGGAAIERVEAVNQQARVFVLKSSATPVVWLADEASGDDGSHQQDPG